MKRLLTVIFKRILDAFILLYLVLIPVIIATGGFKISILGLSIQATHLYTPLAFLIPLVLIRLIISIEINNFLLILGSIFLGVLIMEFVIRIWSPPISNPRLTELHRPSAVFGWDLVPGASGFGALGEYYQINASGLRDVEYPIVKKPGVRRIAAIGDSFTFGMGVNVEDTYPKKLERLLYGKGSTFEVINFGVIGHNMWQHYEVMSRRALVYEPDLIVLGLFAGDDVLYSIPLYGESEHYEGPYPFRSYAEDGGFSGLMSHLSLWNFLRHVNIQFEYKYRYQRGYRYVKGIQERKKKYGPGRPGHGFSKAMSGNLEEKKFLEFSAALEKFVTTANAANARTVVVLIPDSVQLNDPYMQAVNRFIGKVCNEMNIPVIDMTPIFEAEENHKSLFLFPFDAHNSPRALKMIAETIMEKIDELGLLGG